MKMTTTRQGPKSFAWSFSKLKNFETCAKRYFHVDVQKDVREESSEQLVWGNEAHDALAKAVGGQKPIHPNFKQYQPTVDKMLKLPGKVMVEQKLAITADFGPCTYFDKATWFRSVADILAVNGKVAYMGDYKTGKVLDESVQLSMAAICVFAHYPEVQAIRCEYIWLKEDAMSRVDIRRSDIAGILQGVLPRVEKLRHAHEVMEFPPKPGGLCRLYCPVKKCPHNGE